MAGYLYDSDQALALDAKLKALYDVYQIPYFHAAECEAREGPFAHLERHSRENLHNKIIDYIKEHTAYGIARCMPSQDYRDVLAALQIDIKDLSDYEMSLWVCIGGVIEWAQRTGYTGKVAYFFEAGSKYQPYIERLLVALYQFPNARENHIYASHTFAEKVLHRPLHTADLFAWEATRQAASFFALKPGEKPKRVHRPQYVRLRTEINCEHTLIDRRQLPQLAPVLRAMLKGRPNLRT